MKRITIMMFVLVSFCSGAFAETFRQDLLTGLRPAVTLAYYGDMSTHPGLRAGISVPLLEGRYWSFNPGVMAGFFIHPRNERSIFLLANMEAKCSLPCGFEASFDLGSGYKRSFVDAPLYGFGDDGKAKQVTDAGQGMFMVSTGINLGWRLNNSLSFSIGPCASVEYPYNGRFLPRLALVPGITYKAGEIK